MHAYPHCLMRQPSVGSVIVESDIERAKPSVHSVRQGSVIAFCNSVTMRNLFLQLRGLGYVHSLQQG